MTTNQQTKLRARMIMATTRPHPCLVTLALLACGWIISYLVQIIGGSPFLIDLDAIAKADIANIFVFDPSGLSPIPTTFWIVFQILILLLSYGYTGYTLHAVRGQPCGFGDLFDGFGVAWKAIVLTVLTDILVTVGSMLFIVPGIIWAYCYSMSSKILMDHPDWSPIRCMRESRLMMRGHKWSLFLLHLSFIFWILLTLFPGVSVFVKPFVSLSEAIFYQDLCGTQKGSQEPPSDANSSDDSENNGGYFPDNK